MNKIVSLLTGLELLYDKPLISNLKRALHKYHMNISDAMSQGQIKSKLWLIDELAKVTTTPGMVFVLGGWYGILGALMLESGKFNGLKIRSFDKDLSCANIADTVNRTPWVLDGWQFKASSEDMFNMDYNVTTHTTFRVDGSCITLEESPDVIINTCCEHIDFEQWMKLIPAGKMIVLQSNNYFDAPDHINCVSSLQEFIERANLTSMSYSGELKLEKYTRYMVIGIK